MGYFTFNANVESAFRKILQMAGNDYHSSEKTGLILPNFSRLWLIPPNRVIIYNPSAHIRSSRIDSYSNPSIFYCQAASLKMTLLSLSKRILRLEATDVRVYSSPTKDGIPDPRAGRGMGFASDSLSFELKLTSFIPEIASRETTQIVEELSRLFRDGRTQIPIRLSGVIFANLSSGPMRFPTRTKPTPSGMQLIIDPGALKVLAGKRIFWKDPMSKTEIDFLSQNPIRLPRLLNITEDARDQAQLAHRSDPPVPEDAYRHVLWSYQLTQAYGVSFAKEMADAHEIGGKNSIRAHFQDFRNNAAGRNLAKSRVPEEYLLSNVLRNPEIIRDERDVTDEMLDSAEGLEYRQILSADPESFTPEDRKYAVSLGASRRAPAGGAVN